MGGWWEMGNGQWAVVLAVEVVWWLLGCERVAGWAFVCGLVGLSVCC